MIEYNNIIMLQIEVRYYYSSF